MMGISKQDLWLVCCPGCGRTWPNDSGWFDDDCTCPLTTLVTQMSPGLLYVDAIQEEEIRYIDQEALKILTIVDRAISETILNGLPDGCLGIFDLLEEEVK